jgi:hypothetical protein
MLTTLSRKTKFAAPVWLLWTWLPALGFEGGLSRTAAEPQVNGRIEHIDSIRVIRVFGTPQEMGFAHGYLLADDIVSFLEDASQASGRNHPQAYAERLRLVEKVTRIPPDTRAELQGIIDGIKARKGELPTLKASGNSVGLLDLIAANAGDLTRAFACSGFTVWGERAGTAGVITARNFDFVILSKHMLAPGLILVRAPAGKKAVATVAMPGYIGVITGLNEDGVCAFIHDGNGPHIAAPTAAYVPLALALKDFAEGANRENGFEQAETILRAIAPYPFSYMARIVRPRAPGEAAAERVFRLDADGLGVNEQRGENCITTNHYVGGPGEPRGDSAARFSIIAETTAGTVSPEVAWEALAAVAAHQPACTTLHSAVIYPELRRLEIAFAAIGQSITPAPKNRRASLSFDQLFSKGPAVHRDP